MAVSLVTGARNVVRPPWIRSRTLPRGTTQRLAGPGTAGYFTGAGALNPTYQAALRSFGSPFSVAGPNYAGLIGGDWEVQFEEGQSAAALARAKAQYRQSLNQALVDLGVSDLGQLGQFGQYIDQDTIAKAAGNKYSTMAKIAQEATQRKAMSNASLAARGILTSGQTTENLENITEAAEGARYSALRDFLSASEAGLTGLADLEADWARRVAEARARAGERAASTYPYGGGTAAQTATGLGRIGWTPGRGPGLRGTPTPRRKGRRRVGTRAAQPA